MFDSMVWSDLMFSGYRDNKFNINQTMFNPDVYFQYYYYGKNKVGDICGPSGSNACSYSKKIAFLKAFSESLERKGMILNTANEGKIKVYDLITKKWKSEFKSKFGFDLRVKTYSDTTGSASSLSTEFLLKKAILELIEKNALFLFWYGKNVSSIEINAISTHTLNLLKSKKLHADVYCVDFGKVHTVITLLSTLDNHYYSAGVSGNCILNTAIEDSVEEAIVLGWADHTRHLLNKNIFPENYWRENDDGLRFIKSKNSRNYSIQKDKDYNVKEIIASIPEWVSTLEIGLLPETCSIARLTTILAYSADLYNGLPNKDVLNVEKKINKMTLQLTDGSLRDYPNLIVR
ncbi:hypothetical protein HU830_06390 [Lactobacillus sp. DCY120]|uniref:YcaO domain-containing protein n=1 Tax=Bombilactobacillus apium TaxID=2675299 RepID=A0A850R7V9_9LACO|nr:hypothetical protein [Bombilactobacillus apium]NVY96782.1 hypothetical protein [Bombilactobacillus apium]